MKNEKKERQRVSRVLENNIYMIGKIVKYCPLYIVGEVLQGVLLGIFNSVDVIYTKELFDTIDQKTPFWSPWGPAQIMAIMALFILAARLIVRFYQLYWRPYLRQRIAIRMQEEIFKKAATTDLANYDDPEYYNDIVWTMNNADSRACDVFSDIGQLINSIVAIVTTISVLATIEPLMSVIIVIGSLLSTLVLFYGNRVRLAYEMERKPITKTFNYVTRVFHLPVYAKELRTSNAGELIKKRFYETTQKNLDVNIKFGKKKFFIYDILFTGVSDLIYYGIIIFMTVRLLAGGILLGGFAASTNVCFKFNWLMADICERIAKFPEHSLHIDKYREFMEREPKIKSGTLIPEKFESLKIENVNFSYESIRETDGEKKCVPVLKNISLEIKRGDKIAFVGYNGAGKTTLIKLIMRLYDATEGVIYYNGKDLRELDINEYRSHIGAVFQDFKLFAASIADNVVGDGYDESMKADVEKALDAATFSDKLATLEEGIDTHLTREYNPKGTNLSGGEAQKVAIARVFAKPYELIIMDEPSAALDPMAEAKLNAAILDFARERTVIFISHRLSTTKIADKIYMLSDGHIIESGSHNELMEHNGKYAEMFRLQAEKYIGENI